MSKEKEGYIYLIHTREFRDQQKDVYKVGKSQQENNKRFTGYKKGYKILLQMVCDDCHSAEQAIISCFKHKYRQLDDYGREYFEGNCVNMMHDICHILNFVYQQVSITTDTLNQNISIETQSEVEEDDEHQTHNAERSVEIKEYTLLINRQSCIYDCDRTSIPKTTDAKIKLIPVSNSVESKIKRSYSISDAELCDSPTYINMFI